MLFDQTFQLAAVDELDVGVVGIHPAVAHVDEHLADAAPSALHERVGLLQLLDQRVAVVGIAEERKRARHEAAVVRNRHAHLD